MHYFFGLRIDFVIANYCIEALRVHTFGASVSSIRYRCEIKLAYKI